MLTLQHLTFQRHERFLFQDLQVTLEAGEMLHVLGNNGAGKTTLLRIISGLLQPSAGHVAWQGINIADCWDDYCTAMLYVGHRHGIKENLTVSENLLLAKALSNKKQKIAMPEALKLVGLEKEIEISASELSMGQHRRLALAKFVFLQAPLWILDEPLVGLDKTGREIMLAMADAHLQSGGCIVVATHQEFTISQTKVRTVVL